MAPSTIDIDPEVIYEYSTVSNPIMREVPIKVLSAEHHQTGPTRVTPFDLSADLNVPYPATSPNLLVSFIRIVKGESIQTSAQVTSQGFYVIRGQGSTLIEDAENKESRKVQWSKGDLFTIPFSKDQTMTHFADNVEMEHGGAALYWIHDAPLLQYLHALPSSPAFKATQFTSKFLRDKVQQLRHDPESAKRNRVGILVANEDTVEETKTLTHVLWSLLNVLPAGNRQPPHRHNSVALDLCISAPPGACYTGMSKVLREDGTLVNPTNITWEPEACFVTPPGWWHEHVNKDSSTDAWVLPLQDAGLVTHQRILDIRFAPDEIATLQRRELTGISLNHPVGAINGGAN